MARSFLKMARSDMMRDISGDGQPNGLSDIPKAAASLLVLGFINQLDDYLTKLPIKTEGTR